MTSPEWPPRKASRSRPERDTTAEIAWLEHAELHAGRSGFAEHAVQRLAAGERAYCDSWANRQLAELLGELCEEAADLGGWGVLALQALERNQTLCPTTRARLTAHLEAAISCGARARRELVRGRLELDQMSRSGAGRPTFTPDVDGRCLNCGRAYSTHAGNRCRPGLRELDETGAA